MGCRMLAVTAATALALAAGSASAQTAGMAELSDFQLGTGQELLDLCSVDTNHEFYVEARTFCLGVMEGIMQYHDGVAKGPDGQMIVCPEGEVTREEAVDMYLAWGEANPGQAAQQWPAEAVIMAALEKWGPCEQ